MAKLLLQLRKDNMQAMKEKDSLKKGVLSLVISAIALAEKEAHEELSYETELGFVQKELKQTKEALQETPSERIDLIEMTKRKITILESYLPKQLSEAEIQQAIFAIIEEKKLEPLKRYQGNIMKEMMVNYTGKTDGKAVSAVLASILK